MTVASESPLVVGEQNDWLSRLSQNSRALTYAGIAVVVVAAGFMLYRTSQTRKEAFAAQELTRARSAAEAGNLPLAASDLTRIIERFSGTLASDDAFILLNQIRLLQGQQQVAIAALREFVAARHAAHAKASAWGLLGGALEDQGQLREAAEAYRQASQLAQLDFLKAQFLLDAGRALVAAGDSAGARDSYSAVLDRFGELEQSAEARIRMAELGGEVPLAPTPTGRQ